jgi:nicotinamide riboside kinase
MIRRICLYGGPSTGKSTTASGLFAQMKMAEYSVEFVQEYIKFWTFLKRPPVGFDQVYVFGKQVYQEDVTLRSGVRLIVTDCPLWVTAYYAYRNQTIGNQELLEIARKFEEEYPALHIFLKRDEDVSFKAKARFHNEEESKAIDLDMEDFMSKEVDYHILPTKDIDAVFGFVKERLDNE